MKRLMCRVAVSSIAWLDRWNVAIALQLIIFLWLLADLIASIYRKAF